MQINDKATAHNEQDPDLQLGAWTAGFRTLVAPPNYLTQYFAYDELTLNDRPESLLQQDFAVLHEIPAIPAHIPAHVQGSETRVCIGDSRRHHDTLLQLPEPEVSETNKSTQAHEKDEANKNLAVEYVCQTYQS
jgi:hypothetical protein